MSVVPLVLEVLRRFDAVIEARDDFFLDSARPVHREEGFELWVECAAAPVGSLTPVTGAAVGKR